MSTKDTGLDDDNAKFDEFLQRKGELAELLRALPQEQPSAALDAKILADVRRSLQSGLIKTLPGNPVTLVADVGPAANQANGGAAILPIHPATAHRGGFLTRWRVPLGICATLVLSLSVTFEVWQGQKEAQPLIVAQTPKMAEEVAVAEMPAVMSVQMAPERAVERAVVPIERDKPQAIARAKSNELMAEKRAKKEDKKEDKKEAEADAMPVLSKQLADAKVEAPAKPAAPAGPVTQAEPVQIAAASPAAPPPPQSSMVRRMAAPAPMMEVAATATATEPAAAKKSEPAGANSIASVPPDAKTWLAQIEKLIRDDKRTEVLEAWQKFRQAYPDYVVEKTIEKQIEAFRTQE